MGNLTDLTTPWEGYTKGDVEDIIKQEFSKVKADVSSKPGATYFDSTTMIQYSFENDEDKQLWLETKEDSLVLGRDRFEFSGKINQMTVINGMDSKNLYYTQVSESAIITVGFKSEEKGITAASWTEVFEDAYFTVSIDRGVTGSYTTIVDEQLILNGNTLSFDVLKYLATGNNRVKVTVVGADTGTSSNLIYTVTLTTMYIAPSNFKWNIPFIEGSTYSLGGLNIGGNIDKTLKIKVSTKETYSKLYEIHIGTQTYTGIAYYYDGLEFPTEGTGIYNVEIWLDANGLESEHLFYNIICISKDEVKTAQVIAISDVPSTVKNYDTNTLFSYVIYNGGANTASPIVDVSAIINNTPTDIVENEILENVPTGTINKYIIDLEVDTQESNIQLYASIKFNESEQEAIYAIDNSASYPAISGPIFYLNPANRNNSQANKTTIINESNLSSSISEYSATWTNISFTDGMDGWTTDNNGRKCLRIPATCKVDIDYSPFANATTRTIEISYRVENAADYNEDIITMASSLTSDFVGARIKPTNVTLHSSLLKTDDIMQGYNTKDEENVHMIITVVQNYKQIGNLAQVYVNGVKKCSFEWSTADTFSNNGIISLGSQTADLYIYKLRVYTAAFEWTSAIQNYISCLPDTISKKAAYNKIFSVLNDGYQLDFDKIKNGGYNYFVIRLPEGKSLPSILSQDSVSGTHLTINIQQNPDFVINGVYENEKTEGQGTTAMNYFRWNLRWKTDTIRITAKKNFASSMHSHKMGATALFNDLSKLIVGDNEVGGRVAVEQYPAYGVIETLVEGSTDTYNSTVIGLYTIGQDKGDKSTFGFNNSTYKKTLIHLEGTDHSPKAVGMDYPWNKLGVATNSDGDANLGVLKPDGSVIAAWEIGACGSAESDSEMFEYLDSEFRPAYEVDYRNTSMIVGLDAGTLIEDINSNLSAFRATETDHGYTYADCLIWIDGEYDTYYYDVLQEKYIKDGINILSDLNISESDLTGATANEKNLEIRALRKERYRAEMENYWHLRDSLFHYCFIVLFAATDNFKKNTYPYKFGTLESGSRWRWRQDDLDTLFDINNQGLANKIYSLMNGDKSGTTHLFRGNTSYHWTNIQWYYDNEIKSMMREIMTTMASLSQTGSSLIEKAIGCIRQYFWNKAQDYFTKSAYNIDAEWSYEEAWAAMKNGIYAAPVHPLQQSLGSHYEAERAFVELRFIFMASLYGFGAFAVGNDSDTSLGQISFRPAQGDNVFTLTPAINMNPTILVGDSDSKSPGLRLNAGTSTDITISTDGDTSIYIQGTDYLSDIGDFSKVNLYAENPALTVQSKRLQKLKVGDEHPENVTTVLKTLNVLSCPSISEIDARNVPTLTGTIDLSMCPRLKKALFGGSNAGEIVLPNGSKITEFELSDTITNLSLINLPNLTESGLSYGDLTALTYLRIENNSNIDGYALLKATYEDSSPLTNIRIIGFDYNGDATDVELLATLANGNYFGIDADGARNPNIIPVIEGTLTINAPVYEDDYNSVQKSYGAGLVLNAQGGYYIRFADDAVSEICATNFGDGIGTTKAQATSVTDIGTKFYKSSITEFEEFENFTGITNISGGSSIHGGFDSCGSLTKIRLPQSLTTIYNGSNQYQNTGCFKNCTALQTVNIPKNLTQIGDCCFYNCPSLSNVVMESDVLEYIGDAAFSKCSSASFEIPQSVTTIKNGAFSGALMQDVIIDLPNLETMSGTQHFYNTKIKGVESLGKITSIAFQNSPPGYYSTFPSFYQCTNLEYVNLPDTLTSIAAYTFQNCSSLKRVSMPSGLAIISDYLFASCTSLSEINIPQVVETIGNSAFYNCTSLSMDGVSLYNLKTLGGRAFMNCSNIVGDVYLPSLETLHGSNNQYSGVFAASGIENVLSLGRVTILNGYNYTGIFTNCKSLKSVVLPNTLTDIGSGVFNGCTSLSSINLPDTITSISSRSFYDCKAMNIDVNLPNLTTLGGSTNSQAFANSGIKSISSLGTISTIYGYNRVGTFYGCTNLLKAILPSTLIDIQTGAFNGCTSLSTVVIEATTPPTLADIYVFNNTPIASGTGYIYVPDASVDAYKAATNWATYASQIKPLSEYNEN